MSQSILLGITGGVAAYKAAELTRLLVKDGFHIQVAMTEAAGRFVGPATFQALSGRPVLTRLWDNAGAGMAHIDAARAADLILVAPASADFLAKLAQGLADDLLSTLCLARTIPLAVAPAMNREMWANAATQRNVALLKSDGVTILGPASGVQACGETGWGRMLEPDELLRAIHALLHPGPWAHRRVLVTAGPTFEALDPVRGLTNLSSGKMGYAVAQAARAAGAAVTLVSGPTCLASPQGVERIAVQSAADMREAVLARVPQTDIFIAVAAVADYRPAQASPTKLKKSDALLHLDLVPNADILAEVAALPHAPFCVGFAAETDALAETAEAKRRRKQLPLLVGNLAQDTLGRDDAELVFFDDRGMHPQLRADKPTQARRLIEHIQELMTTTRNRQP